MKVCENCGNPNKRTVRTFTGRWKGQNVYEEWTECSICGDTNFVEMKPEWTCRDCEAVGMFEELKYDAEKDDCFCPHCGSERIYEV